MESTLISKRTIFAAAAATLGCAFFVAALPQTAHAASYRWIDQVVTEDGTTFEGHSTNMNSKSYTINPSGDKSGKTDRTAFNNCMGKVTTYGQKWDHRNKAIAINLVKGKTYYIDVTCKLYNNVTFNANGATIKQVTKGKGVFINALYKDSTDNTGSKKKIGGYNRCKNITVNGGTFVTTGKCNPNTTSGKNGWRSGYSTFLFMHGTGIKISGVTIQNNYNGHFIELAGVKSSSIKNCTFKGSYTGDSTNEVIQLDTNYNASVSPQGAPWDGTPCKSITISGCKFNVPKMPVGIGTNYACAKKSSSIKVLNNSFKVKRYALALYKCSKVTATGNAFSKGKVLVHYTASSVKLGKAEKKAKA